VTVASVEVALDAHADLGEGPLWDDVRARLFWVDIMRGLVHEFDPATGRDRAIEIGQPVGAVALAADGSLVLAVRDGFARLDVASGAVRMIASIGSGPGDLRMNDGACDPKGRFWAGTMAIDERHGAGALYRLDPDGLVRTMIPSVTISNGIDWSDDGRTMYYVDSETRRIDRFDFDLASGDISHRRPFAAMAPDSGVPDGLTVDAARGVWVALWGGGALHRYTPDGQLDRVVPLPVTHPTSCAFGGPCLDDLYITSAACALHADARAAQPLAGALLRCRPGVRGRRAHRFGAAR
jgi:sugar lactone lactonase YvrE